MRVFYLTLVIVILDQCTKLYIKGFSLPFINYFHNGLIYGTSIPMIGDFFRITYVENPGMAFGIEVSGRIFLALFSLAASIAIVVYLYKIRTDRPVVRASLAIILGGAIGNLIDRIFYGVLYGDAPLFYGKVVDFFDFDFFDIDVWGFSMSRFPVFNIADSAVTIGVCLLLIFHRSIAQEDEAAPVVSSEATAVLPSEGAETPPLRQDSQTLSVSSENDG
jgi:signal peptidase II